LAIANYVPNMGGWSNPPGKFSMAAEETMTFFPYILSILFMIIGILLLVLGYKNAKKG
jgi:preprotein translocase subunit SecG